jgi:hypothetical protein
MVKKASNSSFKVDFTGVEAGGFEVPDGLYVLAVQTVTQKKSQEAGNPYLSWEFKVDEGKYKGRKVWDNTSLQPQALWKLRGLFENMGMDIEDGEFEVDLEELQGQLVGAEVVNEKYQGKDKPRIASYLPADEVDGESGDEEEQEEEPEPPKKETPKKSTKKPEPEPEPEEEEEEVEEEEAEPEPEPEPPKSTAKKKVIKKPAAPEFEVGMAVTFTDEGEDYKGKIHSVGDDTVEVKVGKDIWELDKVDVTAA